MAYRISKIRDRASFTSDLTETEVFFSGVLDHVALGFMQVQNGATAPTLADDLAQLNEISLKQAGVQMVRINGADLCALNAHAFNHIPTYVLPAGNDQTGILQDVQIPAFFNQKDGQVTIALDHATNADVDGETVTITRKSRNMTVGDRPLRYVTQSYTASTTGALLNASSLYAVGDVVGILYFGTTIPTTTNNNSSVLRQEIRINGVPAIQDNWETLGSDQTGSAFAGDTSWDGVFDNYKYLNLAEDPIPAGVNFEILIESSVADAIRITPVERLRVQDDARVK